MNKLFYLIGLCSFLSVITFHAYSQTNSDSILQEPTLQNCVQYALKHYPLIQQAYLDEAITEHEISSKLADWYPQINFNANYQNNFQLPSSYFNGSFIQSGTYNSSMLGFSVTQNIFNRDVLLASRSANDVRKQVRQTTSADKVEVVVNVSKAFYDVLLTRKQIDLLEEDIARLTRSLKDAYSQYKSGVVDKIDYKQATISLNNAKAEKKSYEELLKAKFVFLKQQMGYTAGNELRLLYDSVQMEKEVLMDTLQNLNYSNRIEFQLLETQKHLLQYNLQYNKWSFIPSVSAFGAYNFSYLSEDFSGLYSQSFPFSYAGIQFAFPIFQGNKRNHSIKAADLEVKRIDWEMVALKNNINTQYAQAMASYKSDLNDYIVLKENLELATEVYNTVQVQYHSGIKAYLDVITAETGFRSAESNYANALYHLLSSKLDVQKALGTIQY